MSAAYETIKSEGMPEMSVELHQDQDAQNPRRDYDPAGVMLCWHRSYDLGDGKNPFSEPYEFQQWAKSAPEMKGALIIPLFLYDHGGITIKAGAGFNDPWDSGPVGWLYFTRAEMIKEWGNGGKRCTKKAREGAALYAKGAVEEYASYLEGDVYGYVVKQEDGGDGDSCWGFIGHKYAVEEARGALAHAIRARRKELREERAAEILAAQIAYTHG